MDLIIVASGHLAPLGRRLAHAVSLQKMYSGTFWTVKHYQDNEAQLNGKQPFIFLGDNEVTKSYADALPEHFRGYGTKCSFEGAMAILRADEPGDISNEDIATLKRAVEDNQEELRRRAASAARGSGPGARGGSYAASVAMGLVLFPLIMSITLGLPYVIYRLVATKRKRRHEYRMLQYEYVLARFLKDEFETYMAGVEGLS